MRTRRDAFDDLVLEVADRARPVLGSRHEDVDFAVEDVPPADPPPWEESVAPLGRLVPARDGRPPVVVVYRRPVEARAGSTAEVAALVGEVVLEQVAALLGVPPDDLEI
jgi:predicted Zn-dependent protease with MMP-like domain